jgi:hypothetical protein
MRRTRPYPATPPTQPSIAPLTRRDYAKQLALAGRLDEARDVIRGGPVGVVVIEVNTTVDRKCEGPQRLK